MKDIIDPDRDFQSIVDTKAAEGKLLCMGLDPVWEKLPIHLRGNDVENPGFLFKAKAFYDFCAAIVDKTHDLVACYKPNAAFFEALGWEGEMYLEKLIEYIRATAPDVAIIIDAKRGDIDNTNNGYVAKYFGRYKLDAITVHPFLGEESLRSFLDCVGKGVIVLCKTSNKGSGEFQDRLVLIDGEERQAFGLDPGVTHIPFYEFIAYRMRFWESKATLCVVVGATCPAHTAKVRGILPNVFILQPGVGTQGGDLSEAVQNGITAKGNGITVNAGSKALYAFVGERFAEATRVVVIEMNRGVQEALPSAA